MQAQNVWALFIQNDESILLTAISHKHLITVGDDNTIHTWLLISLITSTQSFTSSSCGNRQTHTINNLTLTIIAIRT